MKRTTASKTKLIDRILGLVKGAAQAAVLSFTINVTPVPASRPRVGRWGTYYPPTYTKWMKAAQKDLEGGAALADNEVYDGPLFVVIEQVCEKPKTTKRAWPRGDVDNHAKGPLDVITKTAKVWQDDDQIVGMSVFKRYAEEGEQPRTEVHVFKL